MKNDKLAKFIINPTYFYIKVSPIVYTKNTLENNKYGIFSLLNLFIILLI